ncbi:SIR2 family protein [Paenibacillus sp. DMB5]|uniref:SIR2 family NAD-dependent protein deacylase n=1 Tax=Paenibacillus sp. DMB5 TaxID=1780103 RepID=UPI00076CE7D1|nr:SIR2 family protein [Paenibacillus sp. DMB5]KUP25940.1 hypothetical protein AWJ19_33530 [Paenibacillus sp. DMB5]
MSFELESLRKDYQSERVVPFIGAGLSAPFKIPTWKDLIDDITQKYAVGDRAFIANVVNWHLNSKDYWGAIDELKKFAHILDADIQERIVELFRERQITLPDNELHNYADLANLNFKLYLTTNYENLLQKYLGFENIPILLKDIDFSSYRLFDEQRVCHLHGHTSNLGTIVLSRQSYENLYKEKKYENILKLVTGTRKILFMGFSFDDQFIRTLIKDHKECFQTTHYILLSNPTEEKIALFRKEYGLITIPYSTACSTHTLEIRKILKAISQSDDTDGGSKKFSDDGVEHIIVGAGLSELNQDVENNLFYKKLKLENIDEDTVELTKLFYVAAEKYIRQLKKSGMNITIIDAIFYKVFGKYKEKYVDTYKQYGDSCEFVNVVHKSLETIDFGRYEKLFQGNKSDENENRGMIHLLADENDNVWWGDRRIANQ